MAFIPGCFSLNASQKDEFHRGKSSVVNNSAFECAMACPSISDEYVFLKVGFPRLLSHKIPTIHHSKYYLDVFCIIFVL